MLDVGAQPNVTPISGPPYIHVCADGTAKPHSNFTKPKIQATPMSSGTALTIRRGNDETPIFSRLSEIPRAAITQDGETSEDAVLVATRDSRIALLVKQYDSGSTKEESARLEILNRRLRQLSPRVTIDDVNELSNMLGRIEAISARTDEIKGKFNLR